MNLIIPKHKILSGTKTWISNSPVADVFIVWARSDRHNNQIKVRFRSPLFSSVTMTYLTFIILGFYSRTWNEGFRNPQNWRKIVSSGKDILKLFGIYVILFRQVLRDRLLWMKLLCQKKICFQMQLVWLVPLVV